MNLLDKYREEYPDVCNETYEVDQRWDDYTAEEHDVWRTLYRRQMEVLPGRACDEFMDGLKRLHLGEEQIPDFRRINEELEKLTGWRVIAVPGLVPDDVFFDHLANRRFVSGQFIRKREQLDYLEEPDIFHDVFGHVPLLANPVFADHMYEYGKGGLRAMTFDALPQLARIYWYTVEFGLINTPEGMRIFGAGIVSSKGESIFSLEDPSPNRVHFDLERVMRTKYRIDDFQQTYFVINSFEEFFDVTVNTDFGPIYPKLKQQREFEVDEIAETDIVHTRGTQAYANARKAAAV